MNECHQKKSITFDNTKEIPADLIEKYSMIHKNREIQKLWDHYLDFKFKYLLQADETDLIITKSFNDFRDQFKNTLTKLKKDYLIKFIDDWEEKRKIEDIAFFVRFSQLRDDIIYEKYYSLDIKGCYDWCDVKTKKMKTIANEGIKGDWKLELRGYCGNIEGVETSILDEWKITNICRSAFNDLKIATEDDLSDYTYFVDGKICHILHDYDEEEYYSENFESFLSSLSFDLIGGLYPNFDKKELIKKFLLEIKDRFKCEVCDYLDVEKDNSRITYLVATVDESDYSDEFKKKTDEEAFEEIKERESYKKGIGISGCILYYDFKNINSLWNHIGSNNVDDDPRQSSDHRHAYEKEIYPNVLKNTGTIKNFWMFPITLDENLIGTFRVVNKLNTEEELQKGGWNFFNRLELILIARWFSKFLKSTNLLLQYREDFNSSLLWSRSVDKIYVHMKLNGISRDFIKIILNLFQKVMIIKEEKRAVGITVIITNAHNKKLKHYPFVDLPSEKVLPPYTAVFQLLDAINPLKGAFIFDVNGDFTKVVSLKYDDHIGYEAIKKLTRDLKDSIVITLPRNTRSLLFFKEGEMRSELYQAEKTGKWECRDINKMKNLIKENSGFKKDTSVLVDKVLDIALGLSQLKLGGMIIIGDVPEDKFTLDTRCKVLHDDIDPSNKISINKIDISILTEYAKMDGAMIIDSDGNLIKANTFIVPKQILQYKFELPDKNLYIKDLKKGIINEALINAFEKNGYPDLKTNDIVEVFDRKFIINSKKKYEIENIDKLNVSEDIGHPVALKGRGGRHQTCEKVCRIIPDNLGIVISENGSINIVKDSVLLHDEEHME